MRKTIHRVEYEHLRDLVREIRHRRGMRQEDLAAQLGVAQNFVSNVERGVRRLDVIELRDVCLALDTDLVSFCKVLERRLVTEKPPRRQRAHKTRRARTPSR
jgi:transcriptional regulator with XRE-family HTH domain